MISEAGIKKAARKVLGEEGNDWFFRNQTREYG